MQATEIDVNPVSEGASHKSAESEPPSDLELRCPRCKAGAQELECIRCGFQMRDIDGIFHSLPPERVVHFARFIEEYERIRSAEGRGSEGDGFYLGLPYVDTSSRNSAQWRIRARTFDCLVRRALKPKLAYGGRILDLGAGNCWLSYRLALAGYRPCAVDLLTNDYDGLGAAKHYQNYLPEFFPRFRAELTRLPFQDSQFDAAVFNASFHYADNFETVLQEALRCCKKNGIAIICDTPWYASTESGEKMVAERHSSFLQNYGTESASIRSLEYLTDERLKRLEVALRIRWTIHTPYYGFQWSMRPLIAKLHNRREPAQFRVYVARKAAV